MPWQIHLSQQQRCLLRQQLSQQDTQLAVEPSTKMILHTHEAAKELTIPTTLAAPDEDTDMEGNAGADKTGPFLI